MRSRSETSLLIAIIAVILSASPLEGQASATHARKPAGMQSRRSEQGAARSQTTARFNLDQSHESPTDFNLILSDGDERSVSGVFFVEQLYNFRDLMLEAKNFAFTEEAVGKDEPITTRFSNNEDRAFVIDVSKRASQSQFFVTIKTMIGQLTVDAGTITRSDKREEGLFFDMLKRLQSQIAKSTGQPIK